MVTFRRFCAWMPIAAGVVDAVAEKLIRWPVQSSVTSLALNAKQLALAATSLTMVMFRCIAPHLFGIWIVCASVAFQRPSLLLAKTRQRNAVGSMPIVYELLDQA